MFCETLLFFVIDLSRLGQQRRFGRVGRQRGRHRVIRISRTDCLVAQILEISDCNWGVGAAPRGRVDHRITGLGGIRGGSGGSGRGDGEGLQGRGGAAWTGRGRACGQGEQGRGNVRLHRLRFVNETARQSFSH